MYRSPANDLIIYLFLLYFSAGINNGLAATIKGQVLNQKDGSPLIGVNVQLLGTLLGSSTHRDGFFFIRNVPPGQHRLLISMMGFQSETRQVSILTNSEYLLTIKMHEAPILFDPVVVSASKSRQRLDRAPVSMSVITVRDIIQRQPSDLIEALETAPGIHFVGNQINIRGSTGFTFGVGNKVLLLLDGVPVYASDTGEFNWDMLPPLDVEQIEVVKGAGSTLWGSTALGGLINIITRAPSREGNIQYAVKFGQYDRPYYNKWEWTDPYRLYYTREDLSISKQFKAVGLRLSAGRYHTTGYTQLGDAQKYNLTSRLDINLPRNIKWIMYTAFSHIHRGFFVQWKGPNDPYEVDESNLQNYARLHQLNAYSKIYVPISPQIGVQFRASFVRTLMGNQFGAGADFNPAYGQGAEIQSDWIMSPQHHVTIGVQYQQDAGSTQYFGDHKGYAIGPYIQDEWTFTNQLEITLGCRYDRYQLVHGRSESLVSPRLGLNWEIDQRTHVRASVGSGFRAATIVERYLELSVMNFKIIANPELHAETCWAYDLGIRHTINDQANLDISLFDNEYYDLIEANMDLIRGQIQFINIPRARIQGIETTFSFQQSLARLLSGLVTDVKISTTAMHHEELQWHDPLPYRPNVLTTISNRIQYSRFQLQTDFRYASKINEVKIYPINKRVPMKFIDLRLSVDIMNLIFHAGISNLLNYNYAPMESNLMPMRTFTLGLHGRLP
ncbi:TonB-dependent receptor [candidate division KSB1 bacterium]|nr:TonB-dependent receptor [candidate division KSB1 bacterium]